MYPEPSSNGEKSPFRYASSFSHTFILAWRAEIRFLHISSALTAAMYDSTDRTMPAVSKAPAPSLTVNHTAAIMPAKKASLHAARALLLLPSFSSLDLRPSSRL